MSSLIEFRNLTFNGDQVTFDIHIPLPPAAEWEGFALYGAFKWNGSVIFYNAYN